MPPKARAVSDRIVENVVVNPTTGCWLWSGFVGARGYPFMTVNRKGVPAHRLSYMTFKGEIPPSMCVCHTCDVRHCIRPDHLFLGTHKDNHHDMIAKGRNSRGEGRPDAKLTQSDVINIRADTRILRLIAADYGVHPSVIWNAKNRVTWKHVA